MMRKLFSIVLIMMLLLIEAGCEMVSKTGKKTIAPTQTLIEKTTAIPTLQPTVVSTVEPTPKPTDTPNTAAAPPETGEKKSMYDSLPRPTPVYEPTDEDLAFKEQVISEGKTSAFDMSEWEMIDIMCDILGLDEYLYRLVSYNEYPNEQVLCWVRDEPEGLHYTVYILDTLNGDIFYEDENDEKYIAGNIFTSEKKEEPFRLSEYNKSWLIDQFVKNILHGELPDGLEVEVGYDGMHDIFFTTYKIVDGEIDYLKDYWVTEETGEVDDVHGNYYGILFD